MSPYCTTIFTHEQCSFSETVSLQLQPIEQDVCLLLRNNKNQPAGTISLRIHDIAYACQQKTECYTRDHKFYTEFHHQCFNSKSCKGETCKGIAKENPGFTYCSPSSKCLWCDWCFRCKESCIFKVYAWATSDTIYRIFTCPTWSITVTGTTTLETPTRKQQHEFVLQPAR
ncbi:hypothetical protein RB195_002839 [Necator americanus]|uniref:Phlebovirus glycoprotein G2 fusion domain-containing protein n=1 Tax=Necator americanus TaxID=51031 RepID=A0ABR1DL46_NECAM